MHASHPHRSPALKRYACSIAGVLLLLRAGFLYVDRCATVTAGGNIHHGFCHALSNLSPQGPKRSAGHIYLLKTHKCASTTLQRIVISYGLKNNLSFALPKTGFQFWPNSFTPAAAKRTSAYPQFDIMAVHARHSPQAARFMRSDTAYISIVRDPAEQLQSSYEYYGVSGCLDGMTVEEFLDALGRARLSVIVKVLRCRPYFKLNMQLYDFGLDVTASTSRDWVSGKIKELDAAFHHVLVAELFDESLVLLGDLLNWALDDLVYVKINAREKRRPISESGRKAAYEWNWADKMLYDHFRLKMENAILAKKDYVKERVERLSVLQRHWSAHCLRTTVSSRQQPEIARESLSDAEITMYELTSEGSQNASCRLKTMSELSVINLMNEAWPEIIPAS